MIWNELTISHLKMMNLKICCTKLLPIIKKNYLKKQVMLIFAYEITGLARYRANFFQQRWGVGAVFREIPNEILTAEQLDLPGGITKLAMLHEGMVLVTGPTGSGKSTTLAAMVDHINKK